MKKYVLVLLPLMLAISVNAQLNVGLTGGLNISKSDFHSVIKTLNVESTTDYFAGFSPVLSVSDRFSIVVDILYSRRGHKFASSGSPAPQKRYHFIDFVPQVEFKFTSILGVTAGIHIGTKLGEEGRFGNSKWTELQEFERIRDLNLGYNFGARTHLGSLVVFVRYSYGLSDLTQIAITDAEGNTIEDFSQTINFWQLGISYIL